MPRGRHRHSPPLHRLLPPTAIAGVSLVCALGPWMFTDHAVLRVSAAVAAATAAVGAAVMRRWDVEAGKRVAELTRARAGDEWRHEEQVAELETDLEESRELRQKLEHRLRAKRAELAALRNEHAALLRRYATAETERASALEGRRRLVMETSSPAPGAAKELPTGNEGASGDVRRGRGPADGTAAKDVAAATGSAGSAVEKAAETERPAPGVFSPSGASLFLRANSALDRLVQGGSAQGATPRAAKANGGSVDGGSPQAGSSEGETAPADAAEEDDHPGTQAGTPEAAKAPEGHERAAAEPAGTETEPAGSGPESAVTEPVPARSSGHFTVSTAVAVVPAASRRRPATEGGFDFFGTQKGAAAIEAVQNEDLADVVGQEALALHKAESEAQFKPMDEESRGIGQVIDLMAHDETEQIDVQGLRTAAS